MSIEQPKIESQSEEVEKSKAESESRPEKFDKFMVPEDWIEDISDAQKEAYRVKVLALSIKKIRESWKPETKTEDDQPSPFDYKSAEIEYHHVYGPRSESGMPESENPKFVNFIGDNIAMAYLELRARMLARSERAKEKRIKEK